MKNKNPYTLFKLFLLSLTFPFILLQPLVAQQSGRIFEFINLPSTARITALGGYATPAEDNDLGMALFYPSLVNPSMKHQLSLNFVDYFGDISYGTAAYATHFEQAGSFSLGVQYINYGTFIEADEFGNKTGEFTSGEYAINLGWGRPLTERISIGSNLKAIFSALDEYSSFGLAADVSVSYHDPERLFSSSLVFRNIGRQIVTYHDNEREPIPFDIVLGVSQKLVNAPLRFSFVAHNLHHYDLTYEDPIPGGQLIINDEEDATSQERLREIGDNLLRHVVVGMEFLPTKNFMASIGYNYRRRQEMTVDSRLSTVGLSWGIGIRVSNFTFQYGRSKYHLAGAPNHFSITTDLEALFFRPDNNQSEP